MDVERLHTNILSTLSSDPTAQTHLSDSLNPRWTTDANGFLCLDGRIYVPEADDLRLRVLRYKHDHPLSGHFGQSHTLCWSNTCIAQGNACIQLTCCSVVVLVVTN